MVFSNEDMILIKNLYHLKGYFQTNAGRKISINRLLKKFGDTNAVNRLTDSGGPRSTRSKENVDLVNDLVLSQEDTPQTHRTVRENLTSS